MAFLDNNNKKQNIKPVLDKAPKSAYDFINTIFQNEYENLYALNDKVYALSDECENLLSYNLDF